MTTLTSFEHWKGQWCVTTGTGTYFGYEVLFLFIKFQPNPTPWWLIHRHGIPHNITSIREYLHSKRGARGVRWQGTQWFYHMLYHLEAADWSSSLEVMLWEDGVHSLQIILIYTELAIFIGHVFPIGRKHEIQNQGVIAGVASLAIIQSDPLRYFMFLISRNLGSLELETLGDTVILLLNCKF